MSATLKVDVSREALEAPLEMERRIAALRGAGLNQQIGRRVGDLFSAHFFRLDAARRNKMGGTPSHFWANTGKSVSSRGDAEEAVVTVAQLGFRQRLEGGTIKPVNGKYLTIPARAEAYGRRAREFKNLKFVPLGNGRGMLVAKEDARLGKRGLGKNSEGLALYWLVPSVVQKADPSVLPKEEIVRAVVKGTIDLAWDRAEKRGAK